MTGRAGKGEPLPWLSIEMHTYDWCGAAMLSISFGQGDTTRWLN